VIGCACLTILVFSTLFHNCIAITDHLFLAETIGCQQKLRRCCITDALFDIHVIKNEEQIQTHFYYLRLFAIDDTPHLLTSYRKTVHITYLERLSKLIILD